MTDEQALALARLMRDRPSWLVAIKPRVFDLPEGYVEVVFNPGGFTCGIAPDGRVSS